MDFRILKSVFVIFAACAPGVGCQMLGETGLSSRRGAEKSTSASSRDFAIVRLARKNFDIQQKQFSAVTDRKLIDLTEGSQLRAVLGQAFPTGGFRSIQGDEYHDQLVMIQRGPLTQLIPISLVERHEMGDFQVKPGDAVEILRSVDTDVLRKDQKPSPSGTVVVSGLIPRPGSYRLNRDASTEDKTVRQFLKAAGLEEFSGRTPDLVVLTRIQQSSESATGELTQTFIPLRESDTFKADDDASERYKALASTYLKDGDILRVTNLSMVRSVIEGRARRKIAERISNTDTQAEPSRTSLYAPITRLTRFLPRLDR